MLHKKKTEIDTIQKKTDQKSEFRQNLLKCRFFLLTLPKKSFKKQKC